MNTWLSLETGYPRAIGQYRVKDTIAGPEYVSRFNGAGRPWTIISFPSGYVPHGVPSFYMAG